jgi:hypothetical protein
MFRAKVGCAGTGRIGAGAVGWRAGCTAGEVARIGVRGFKYGSDGFEFCAAADRVASGDRNPDGGGLFFPR